PKVAVARAEALRPQVVRRMAAGWTAHLVTLTVRHSRRSSLRELLGVQRAAWGRLTSGREWVRTVAPGKPGFVCGFDYTWSRENGHHLHLHVLLLLPPGHGDGEAFAEWFWQRWIVMVRAVGGDALPAAQDVRRADDPEAAAAYAMT